MKRILYVHQDGERSGSAISLANLLRGLDRGSFESHVLLAREGPARALFSPLAASVSVVPGAGFWTSPSPSPFDPNYYKNFSGLRRNRAIEDFMRRLGPDLVHVNDKAILCGGRAAARLGLPVIWHLRSAYAGGKSRLQEKISFETISRTATCGIAISEDEVEGFDQRMPVRVIFNTIDLGEADVAIARRAQTRRELGLSDDETAVGMVGLLNETKGAWDFIRAAGHVVRHRPDLKLRFFITAPIPGREPLNWGWRGRLGLIDRTHPEDRAWQIAREAGIADRLVLTGHRPNIMAVLAGLDVVSVCYRLWAVGRPAFEGMAVGRAVVANEGHSGRSRVVRHGETGLVVPRANPEALSEALLSLVSDVALRERLGRAARTYAREHFDLQRNIRQVEAVYREALSRPCRRRKPLQSPALPEYPSRLASSK